MTAELGRTVSVVRVPEHEVIATIPIAAEGAKPMGIEISPDGRSVYVATGRGGDVIVIDALADSVVAAIPVGERPGEMALTPDGGKLYTANGPGDDVSVVDVKTGRVVATVRAGKSPWGVAIVPEP